jgi:hypothetical protein
VRCTRARLLLTSKQRSRKQVTGRVAVECVVNQSTTTRTAQEGMDEVRRRSAEAEKQRKRRCGDSDRDRERERVRKREQWRERAIRRTLLVGTKQRPYLHSVLSFSAASRNYCGGCSIPREGCTMMRLVYTCCWFICCFALFSRENHAVLQEVRNLRCGV